MSVEVEEPATEVLTPLPPIDAELADSVARSRAAWRLPPSTALLLAGVLLVVGFLSGVVVTRAVAPAGRPAVTPSRSAGANFPGFNGGGNRNAGNGQGGAGAGQGGAGQGGAGAGR